MVDKVISPPPRIQFFDAGLPAAGYQLFVYEAGSATKATTWTSATGQTPNTNPIILDEQGMCDVWLLPMIPEEIDPLPSGPAGPQGPQGVPGPPGATGNTAEFSNTIDILSETIYTAFYGEYIELVPAPAADETIVPVMVVIQFKYATTPYATNSANFVLNWGPPLATFPVPNGSFTAAILEGVVNAVLILPSASLYGESFPQAGTMGCNLTLTIDAAPNGAPAISAIVSDGGTGYAVNDAGTIDTGDGNATYEIATESGGVAETVTITFGGEDYENETNVATTATSGGGTGMTLDVTSALTTSGTMRVTTFYRKVTRQ